MVFSFWAVWLGCGPWFSSVTAAAENLTARYDQAHAEFASGLEQLASWCDEHDLPAQAAQTRAHRLPTDPFAIYLGKLEPSKASLPADASDDESQWFERFWQLRARQAGVLFKLAQAAIHAGRVSLAFQLVHETVRQDPEHEAARRLLGYQQFGGEWLTVYEIRKRRSGQVWHKRFGWIPADQVAAYESGKRLVSGRWVSAEEAAARHRDIRHAWRVETEHFVVLTNHSLEAGVALGTRLEALHRVWWQLFVRYFADAAQLEQLFRARRSPLRNERRHRVIYYRDARQYEQAMRRYIPPNVKVTSGIYLNDQRTAYFFHDKIGGPSTIYHEATHQLFAETRPVAQGVGLRTNFWVIEGIACYMESLTEVEQGDRVGGREAVRLADARYRALDDRFYVPLGQLVRMGRDDVQHEPRIAMLYSEFAGLTHFLMHAKDGRYRDALTAYLRAVYTGQDQPATLAQLTGVPFEQLDRQYLQYLRATLAP